MPGRKAAYNKIILGYIEIIARSFPTLSTKDPVLYAGFIAIDYIPGCFIYFIASYPDDRIYENVGKVFWHNPALTAYIDILSQVHLKIEDSYAYPFFLSGNFLY